MTHSIKILHIIGARPHYMKLAPIAHIIERDDSLSQVIVDTGQHYDSNLSSDFAEEFNLPEIKYHLESGGRSTLDQMGFQLSEIEKVLDQEKPNIVLVYGDTNSTAAGAIAAAKLNFLLGHVEAGLREFDKSIPEEVNKLLVDAVSDFHFCPTENGVVNLKKQGFSSSIYFTGDVVVDYIAANENKLVQAADILHKNNVTSKEYVLMTCHRAANTDTAQPLKEILNAANEINSPVLFLRHPRTKKAMATFDLMEADYKNIIFQKPQSFWDTQRLIKHAKCVLTDSGGVIRESYLHGVPSIVTDVQTEWTEIVDAGWSEICGPSKEGILDAFQKLKIPAQRPTLFKLGAAQEIVNIIKCLEIK